MQQTRFSIEGLDGREQNRIWLDNKEIHLEPSLQLRRHNPDGFNWGCAGSGPSQTALAICMEIFKDNRVALALYEDFKFQFVATWTGDYFYEMIDISDFLVRHEEVIRQAKGE